SRNRQRLPEAITRMELTSGWSSLRLLLKRWSVLRKARQPLERMCYVKRLTFGGRMLSRGLELVKL
ncbi:hypothetical protein A2U01_0086322, partial [Trifolium medium]|nr:hypothetical protein [Trifolium medium]